MDKESSTQLPSMDIPPLGILLKTGGTTVLVLASAVPEVMSKRAEADGLIYRNVWPEPWDVPDHVGNIFEGGLYTAGAFTAIALARELLVGQETNKTRRIAAGGALAVSSVVQIVGEKISAHNTPDTIDSVYGIGYSLFAVSVLMSIYKKADSIDRENKELLDNALNNYSLRNFGSPHTASPSQRSKKTLSEHINHRQQRRNKRKQ